MIVKLTADVDEYLRGMKDSQKETAEVNRRAEETQDSLKRMADGMSGWAGTALDWLGKLGVAVSLGGAYQVFEEHEQNSIRLNASIKAGGHTVDEVMPRYREFAEALANVSTETSRSVLRLVQQAEVMGHSGADAETLTRMSVALAGATGQSAQSMMHIANLIREGHPEMAKRALHLREVKDASELVDKIQQRMATGMEIQAQLAKSGTVQLQKLGESLRDMAINIGGAIARTINPMIQSIRSWVEWFKELDPTIKSTTTAIVGLLLAIRFAPQLMSMISPIFTFFKSFLTLLMGPWAIALAAIAIGVTVLIDHFGSWQDTIEGVTAFATNMWEQTQEAAQSFFEWVNPVWKSFVGVLDAGWRAIVEGTTYAANAIVETVVWAWNSVSHATTVNWGSIRNYIRDMLIGLEFNIRNIGPIFTLVSTGIAYDAVKTFNVIKYWITELIPAAGAWMVQNWSNIMHDIGAVTSATFSHMGQDLGDWLSYQAGLLDRTQYLQNLRANAREAAGVMQSTLTRAFVPPTRVPSEVEEELRREYNRLGANLGESWAQFYRRRVEEVTANPVATSTMVRRAADLGNGIGEALTANVKTHMHKLDAALYGSSEALQHLQDYQDRIFEERAKHEDAARLAREAEDRRQAAEAPARHAAAIHALVPNGVARDEHTFRLLYGERQTPEQVEQQRWRDQREAFRPEAQQGEASTGGGNWSDEARNPTYKPLVDAINTLKEAFLKLAGGDGAGLEGA